MEISLCFMLIQQRESEDCSIEGFMEGNGNRSHTGLIFFVYRAIFSHKKREKT